jgi:type I restriction enzyme, S subunit
MIRHHYRTILGDIPTDWEAPSLHMLLSDHLSGDWGDDHGETTLSVLRSTNFTDEGSLDTSDVAMRGFSADKARKIQVQKGDILLERSGGGPNQPVGRAAMVREEMPATGFANFVQLLRPAPDRIVPELLLWNLHQFNRSGFVTRLQHQTTQMRNLDLRDYLKVRLPVPLDPAEQVCIADTLRAGDGHIRALEGQIRKLQRLKRALLQSYPSVPKHGHGIPLFRRADISAGFTKGRDLAGYETMKVAYLTVVNVLAGSLDLRDVSEAEIKTTELDSLRLHPGDVLMTEGGDRDKLGRGCIWQGQIDPIVCQNHIFRVRPDAARLLPMFLHYLLQTPNAKRYFVGAAKQTSNLCTINSRDLRRFLLPELDTTEQKPWVARLQASDDLVGALQGQLVAARRLKQSLLQNLLTGKIRLKA